jgi:tRNA/rRNA methyltransferase
MNLGQAVAVCLFGLARSVVDDKTSVDAEPVPAGEIEKITQLFYEALKISGYVKPGNDAVSEKKVRRLMLRLNLEALDAKVLLGMVRQILWKLRRSDKN